MRCSICDCSSDPSISVTEECYGRTVTWDAKSQRYLCDVCLEEIYFAGLAFVEDRDVPEDLEELEVLEFEGLEGFEGSNQRDGLPSEEE